MILKRKRASEDSDHHSPSPRRRRTARLFHIHHSNTVRASSAPPSIGRLRSFQEQGSNKTTIHPQPTICELTEANLRSHSKAMNTPITPSSTRSAKRSKITATSDSSRQSSLADVRLNLWSIFLDRHKEQPFELEALVKHISRKRIYEEATPKSKAVVRMWKHVSTLSETEAIHAAANDLFYKDFVHIDGEPDIKASLDALWRSDCVPKPVAEDDEALARALASEGVVSSPKPDIAFGYHSDAFNEKQQAALVAVPHTPLANVQIGWPMTLPYLIVEWKSAKGTLASAHRQARRDGAAAVQLMHNFFSACGEQNPSAASTAVFSACVDDAVIEMRVHWRRVANDGTVTYEADWLDTGVFRKVDSVFAMRTIVENVLEWAKESRLAHVKSALLTREERLSRGVGPSTSSTATLAGLPPAATNIGRTSPSKRPRPPDVDQASAS